MRGSTYSFTGLVLVIVLSNLTPTAGLAADRSDTERQELEPTPRASNSAVRKRGVVRSDPSTLEVSAEAVATVQFRWPMRIDDWFHTSNYVDLQSGIGLFDYFCRGATYDGHGGNDIIIRDFVEMDEGRIILAAVEGIVIGVEDGHFDRNTTSNTDPSNYVILEHSDGTQTEYLHLRKWSTMVHVGQEVFEGQPLGYMGSSGSSTDPHLHFGVVQAGVTVEPYAGPCRG